VSWLVRHIIALGIGQFASLGFVPRVQISLDDSKGFNTE